MATSLVNNPARRASLSIRTANAHDADQIWEIFRAVAVPGDTYAFDPNITREKALAYWFSPETYTFVALSEAAICGTYILKANQPGLGAHVANAAFMVAPVARGQGVGRIMAEHCLAEATRQGFRAMQFNFVVRTNAPALALWKSLGFRIVGTLPGAFRHQKLGFVDAYVMFRSLDSD